MSLTRAFLKGMNLTDEQVGAIIEAHTDTVEALKSQRDQYKENAEKLPAVQKELNDLKAATESGDSLKVKYDAIKDEFDKYKKDVELKETRGKKETAYRALLKEAGVSEKRLDAVLKVTNLDKLKLDKDGNFEDADNLKKGIKEEWADFIVTTGTVGANPANPPAGGKVSKTKEEIMAIKDTAERQKAIAENHELFGF